MDQELNELEKQKTELDHAIGAAQCRLSTDGGAEAAKDLAGLREQQQLTCDRIEGLKLRRIEEAEKAKKLAAAIEQNRAKEMHAAAHKKLQEIVQYDKRIDRDISRLQEDVRARHALFGDLCSIVPAATASALREIWPRDFKTIGELITAELFSRGLVTREMDYFEARDLAGRLVGLEADRVARAGAEIDRLLSTPTEEK